jgi:hypothetical protein
MTKAQMPQPVFGVYSATAPRPDGNQNSMDLLKAGCSMAASQFQENRKNN